MEAKELMIGDKVYLIKGYFMNYSLSTIKRKEIMEIDGYYLHKISEGLLEVEPIPPTREILEKNGWVRRNIKDIKWAAIYERNDYPDIWEDIDGNLTTMIGYDADVQIDSVSQLQHILRMCGQTEMADNLKI